MADLALITITIKRKLCLRFRCRPTNCYYFLLHTKLNSQKLFISLSVVYCFNIMLLDLDEIFNYTA